MTNKFLAVNIRQSVFVRNNLLKTQKFKKKVVIFKRKNKQWRPWPKWKRRMVRYFDIRKRVKKSGNISYYKNLYKYMDGSHNSYWLGKLTNGFIKKGRKVTIEIQVLRLFAYTKLYFNHNLLELLLDSIERVKPVLKIGSYVRSGKRLEYPLFLKPEKRRRVALQNIIKLIKEVKEQKLYQKISVSLLDLAAASGASKYDLLHNRDELFDLVAAKGENLKSAIRYLRRK